MVGIMDYNCFLKNNYNLWLIKIENKMVNILVNLAIHYGG